MNVFLKYLWIVFGLLMPFMEVNASPVDLVNLLQGTNSQSDFSTGNTYPAVAVPWGMNFWTPQTRNNGDGWQYVYTDLKIQGFKQTHQPSPWINDYGCFSIMPQVGVPESDQNKRAVSYRRENEKALPYLYEVKLDNDIRAAMSATNSGAAFKFDFPKNKEGILLVDCFDGASEIFIDSDNQTISGYSSFFAKNNGVCFPKNFRTYFVICFNQPISEYGCLVGRKFVKGKKYCSGRNALAYVSFGKAEHLELKVASSFISYQQAKINLERELGKKNFRTLQKENRDVWNKALSRVSVKGGTLENQRTFYSALYRTMLFPRKTTEWNEHGKAMHYSFFNGKVCEGPMYTDNGFWDTFRAVHPFFTIMHPSLSADLMEGLLNIYKEGGWLPEWFSGSYKDCMIGQNSVSVITDALLKGIDSFDQKLMFEAMCKGAEHQGPLATGRVGIEFYDSLGYIPCDVGIKASVSRTLEYAYDDFCMAKYAEKIGAPTKVVDHYRKRALSYQNLIDKDLCFVRPKQMDGEWKANFAPDDWGRDFTEGSSWHWTWCVFHDVKGLQKMIGGERPFVKMLDSVFTSKPTVGLGGRKKMIHEMKEMIAGNMGQYAHGNQPIQHMAYLYNYAGKPYKTQEKVRLIMNRLYHSGWEDGCGLCGDEDNGQTSAWYVFSALGFYPVCPGMGEYIIGSPLFEEVSLKLENGKSFKVKAIHQSPRNKYIQSANLDGKPFNRSFLTHEEIMNGGVLTFIMSDTPNKKWAMDSLPTSLSD